MFLYYPCGLTVFHNITGSFRVNCLCSWMVESLVASSGPVAWRAAALEENHPSVSTSSLQNEKATHFVSSAAHWVLSGGAFPPLKNSSPTSHTFIFVWFQVLWLSWLPVQLSLHEYGNIMVLFLQLDGVNYWCKVGVHQTHPSFFQHLSVGTFLPSLPLNEIKKITSYLTLAKVH